VKYIGDMMSAAGVTDEATIGSDKLQLKIVGTQEQRAKGGNYMRYILEVRQDGKVWRLAHRYEAFFKLSAEICRAFPDKSTIRLPSATRTKKQTGRIGYSTSNKVDEKLIDSRKTTLWQFLQDCITQKEVFESEQFQKFIFPISSGIASQISRRLSMIKTKAAEGEIKELKGVLMKKGDKGVLGKGWKERYCVFDPVEQKVSYYTKGVSDEEPQGELHGQIYVRSVSNASSLSPDEAQQYNVPAGGFGFRLDEPDRTWFLAAKDADTQKAWLDCIKAVMSLTGDLTKTGHMKMQQSKTSKKWNDRYIVLDPVTQSIMIFKQRGSDILKEMHLKDVTAVDPLPTV
jgi:hypothetical protein